MLKLTLCDDDKTFLKELSDHIEAWMLDQGEHPLVCSFSSPYALTASVADGERFDLFVLDVEMPGMDGLETAKELRRWEPNAPLLFLTSHLKYAPEGYKVNALRYVSKLNWKSALPEALEKAAAEIHRTDQKSILVQRYYNYTRILYQEILYVHKDRRNVEIVTADQEPVTDSRGIKELFQELADPRFLFIDRSCFVNLDRVQGLEGSLLVLANGEKLPISRPMLPKVKEAIISLWGKGR